VLKCHLENKKYQLMQGKHKNPNRPKLSCYSDHRTHTHTQKNQPKWTLKNLPMILQRQRPGIRILKSESIITDVYGFRFCDAVTLPPA
jgi:hypothetical protein